MTGSIIDVCPWRLVELAGAGHDTVKMFSSAEAVDALLREKTFAPARGCRPFRLEMMLLAPKISANLVLLRAAYCPIL